MNEKDRGALFQKIEGVFQHSKQPEIIQKTFLREVEVLLSGASAHIRSEEIDPVSELPTFESLERYQKAGVQALSQLVVCKLNGGLGTSMGLERAKSLIEVKDGLSFLEVIIRQLEAQRNRLGITLPFVCMNSFRTESDTLQKLPKNFNRDSKIPASMLQHSVPKLLASTLEPVVYPEDPELEWCPPGHGDLYPVLISSGVLEQSLNEGFRYLFVSNSDNLGATVAPELLGYLVSEKIPFLMEVAERTKIDRKGGHLAQTSKGQLLLRERAQVVSEDEEDFQDYKKYRYFNTNSLWVDLVALKGMLDGDNGVLPLPVIQNRKRVNPRDPKSSQVIQLETAMGSAISLFRGAGAVCVPRTRFLPVKTTDDLLRMRSDVFSLTEEYKLVAHSGKFSLPITLDSKFFGRVDEFEKRFSKGVPSLKEATSFVVRGDVYFGEGVACKGDVSIQGKDAKSSFIDDNKELNGTLTL